MSGASSSQIASAVVAVVVFLVVLAYIAGFYFLSQYAKQHPNTRPKAVVIEKYAPSLCSIVETAISIWILIVYRNSSDYPNAGARSGICLTFFSDSLVVGPSYFQPSSLWSLSTLFSRATP
ncbi:uncharacterized protein FIBRA_08677 [Fibroporia radiculosa]|uniref:Uncharacterized protein n=1 Tax=Fibroporia radiculosa TaxID=599839 RepID=J4ICH4_9APHY|nr:uncharacterized protein FIBRA_08677 [Fibroporia radiculosa]CCM06416.1 predicted protein [Fibroporia radiculosa]